MGLCSANIGYMTANRTIITFETLEHILAKVAVNGKQKKLDQFRDAHRLDDKWNVEVLAKYECIV